MEELTFFEYEDVKVTNARFITGNQTFAMSNITSVKAFTQPPKRGFSILLLVVGLLLTVNDAFAIGIGMVVVAITILCLQKNTYHVMLTTAGGETSALKTKQRQYLANVVGALNEAIVYRG